MCYGLFEVMANLQEFVWLVETCMGMQSLPY